MKLGLTLVFLCIIVVVAAMIQFQLSKMEQIVQTTQVVVVEHKHKPGQFGGWIVELGRDNYHLEVTLSKDGLVTIYTLGKDEAKVITVEKQVIIAYVKDSEEYEQFELMPNPQAGDGDKTSRFSGKIPVKYLTEAEININFNITIAGERFRASVAITQTPQTDLSNNEEKKLYLTPGGIYTKQDIIDNGNMTASQKFKGFVPTHDLKPKKGDRICPITLTKANPKCSWIINGKEYWFCCPPCVEEFVKLAKEHSEQVKLPEEYVK